MIRLIPVGTGAAFGGAVQSCYLVMAGPRCIALDLGSGALAAMERHVAPEDLDAVLISHLHADHCVDLFGLHVRMEWGPGRGRVLPVYGPPALGKRFAAFSGGEVWRPEQGLALRPLAEGGGAIDLGDDVLLRHAEVPHLPPTHAMRVEAGGRALVYGADCGPNEALASLAAGADLLMCECTFGADPVPEGVPHLPAAEAGAIARRAGVGRLLLTHIQPGHDRARALSVAAEAFGGPVAWAEDGVEVVV